MKHFDPWDDAGVLSQRLQCANARAYIVIGATQWCARCRDLRPQFERHAEQALADETWLWLDLVEHEEFIGDYQPENLPMLVLYCGAQLLACLEIDAAHASFDETITASRAPGFADNMHRSKTVDPGIRDRLLAPGWAVK